MARLPRLVVPNHPHHIIQEGNDRQQIFRDEEDYQRFLGWLKDCAREFKVAIHAYALLPTHFHLLATPSTDEGLARMMQRLGRYYVPWFNQKYERVGGLFRGRFKTSLIDSEQYFMMCSRYVEFSPVRAGMVGDPAGYRWSSYSHHAGIRQEALIIDHALYWSLGNTPFQREAAYIALAQHALAPEELATIEQAVLKGWPLGSDAFKTQLQNKAKRQVLPAKRGRPFKATRAET
ncbi:MAG: transposase [Telluria sp.]